MKQSIAVLALLGVSQAIKNKKAFAEGIPDKEPHGQDLKMKGKTLEQFNVVQTKFAEGIPDKEAHGQDFKMKGKTLEPFSVLQTDAKFAEGMPNSQEHGQNIKMKSKTLEPFSFVQTEAQQDTFPRGEKQWQQWAGVQTDFLNLHESAANVRIPYKSALIQTDADNEWVSDTPSTRGEKQWERYNNSSASHLDWSAKTNQHEVRQPYIGGAGLAEQEYSGDTPADRGEKQWAVYNNSEAYKHLDWDTNVSSRRPYNGAARLSQQQFVQTEAEEGPAWAVRGEKQWLGWAQATTEALDTQTDKSNARIPYQSAVQLNAEEEKEAAEKPKYSVRGEKQWQDWAQNLINHQDHLMMKANTRIPYASTVQLDAEEEKDAAAPKWTVRGEKQWQGWAQNLINHQDHLMMKANTRIPYASSLLNTNSDINLVHIKTVDGDELIRQI